MEFIERLQSRLTARGLSPGPIDGVAGPATLAALFQFAGAPARLAADLGAGAAVPFNEYQVAASSLRLAHFMGQAAHETMGFCFLEELGGEAYFARRYDDRADLGNDGPGSGDGARYHGRGIFQLTGEDNYQRMGRRLGVDLLGRPELASDPRLSVQIACIFWDDRKLNARADRDDLEGITRKINGGRNGIEDRRARTLRLNDLLL